MPRTKKPVAPTSTEPAQDAPVIKRDDAARTKRHIRTILRHLSSAPGVYKMLDAAGEVLYVGKAKNVKKRVSSYFQKQQHDPKTTALVARIRDITTITVATEVEALLLETNLIKEHRPPYNILMRDDKNLAFLKITPGGDYPRIEVVRSVASDRSTARYLGPYLNASTPLESLEYLKRLFPIRSCRGTITVAGRPAGAALQVECNDLGVPRIPCLLLHMKRCSGPCVGAIPPEEYRALLSNVERALDGRVEELVDQARSDMEAAAAARQFERAARLRDQVRSLEKLASLHDQVVTGTNLASEDIVHFALGAGAAAAVLLRVRRGRLIDTQHTTFRVHASASSADVLDAILAQLYTDAFDPPDAVLVPERTNSLDALETLLSQRRGKRVAFRVPTRGDGARLLGVAHENAAHHLEETKLKWEREEQRTTRATEELATAIGVQQLRRIECYDISHIQGTSKVGSMIVFLDGAPAKAQYRRFQIKDLAEGVSNDVASLAEVLRRRLAYLKAEEEAANVREAIDQRPEDERLEGEERDARGTRKGEPRKKSGRKKGKVAKKGTDRSAKTKLPKKQDASFRALPDLLLIDGGEGQLSSVRAVLDALGLAHIPVAALAKRQEELYLPGRTEPLRLPQYSDGLYLVQRIRDEAHRFAISYHRNVRAKKMVRSRLDSIPGVGAAAKKKLLARFGSVNGVRAATEDELAAVVGAGLAARLKDML